MATNVMNRLVRNVLKTIRNTEGVPSGTKVTIETQTMGTAICYIDQPPTIPTQGHRPVPLPATLSEDEWLTEMANKHSMGN